MAGFRWQRTQRLCDCLVETFCTMFPNGFKFEGNRSIVFDEDDVVPVDALSFCVAAALTYHRNKKAPRA